MQRIQFIEQLEKECFQDKDEDNINEQDIYIYLESQLSVARLKIYFESIKKAKEIQFNEENFTFLKSCLSERWARIQGFEQAAYKQISEHQSTANKVYYRLAEFLYKYYNNLKIEEKNNKLIEVDDLIKPSIISDKINSPGELIIKFIFQTLKDNNSNILKYIKKDKLYCYSFFNSLLLDIEKGINKQNLQGNMLEFAKVEECDLFLEKKYTLNDLYQIIKQFSGSEMLLTDNHIMILIQFLKKRWERTADLDPYRQVQHSDVDILLIRLANRIHCILLYLMPNYFDNFNKTLSTVNLLQPVNLAKQTACSYREQYLLSKINNRDQLVHMLCEVDSKYWDKILDRISVDSLAKLLSNNLENISHDDKLNKIFESENIYDKNDLYNRAFLFCLFTLYSKIRTLEGANGLIKNIVSIFKTIPDMDKKLAAAKKVCDFLSGGKYSLRNFTDVYKNEKGPLYEFKKILEDSRLKLCLNEIYKAEKAELYELSKSSNKLFINSNIN